ncbi:hypothetical protein EIK77_009449 [Talaromyces pinophilus]|nr:hypothetical protein EIK77_009449 [Talaromyces pinophilus]
MNYPNVPRFDELPLREGDPPLSAWGLWKDPALAPRFSLPLDAINPGLLGRQTFEHRMIDKNPKIVNDDVDIHSHPESDINSINAWSKHALAGRAFLIDYYDWAQEQGISYDPLTTHAVTISDVRKIMEEKNIQPQQGDIFILRTGELLTSPLRKPHT